MKLQRLKSIIVQTVDEEVRDRRCIPAGPRLRRQTSHNKRFSEMAVRVETETRLHPLTAYGILRCGAPRPPLRQAAGRYVTFPLVRCGFVDNTLKESENYQKVEYLYYRRIML